MSYIDDRGRVWGRYNLIDLSMVVLLVLMLPVAYGAYLLFRDPVPRLTAIAPTVLKSGPNQEMQIRGENLRPYMRVSYGTVQGPTYMFGSPTTATVAVPNLPPGKYDVVLYDYAQEVSRLKDALTVIAEQFPRITVRVTGAFLQLTTAQTTSLSKGMKLPASDATILDLGTPQPAVARFRAGGATIAVAVNGGQELPATVAIPCDLHAGSDGLQQCFVGSIPLAPDAVLAFGGPADSVSLRVTDVHYGAQPALARVHARFTPKTDIRGQVRPGDRDVGGRQSPTGVMATLESIEGGAPSGAIDAVLSIEVEETITGWKYKGQPVKAGAPITFETLRYTMTGFITDVQAPR